MSNSTASLSLQTRTLRGLGGGRLLQGCLGGWRPLGPGPGLAAWGGPGTDLRPWESHMTGGLGSPGSGVTTAWDSYEEVCW